jgi:hypothetical protein
VRLYVESDLPVDPATCWEIFESDAFRERLQERARLKQKILEERTEGGITFKKIRTEPERELPAVAAKLLGASKLSYVQSNRLDVANNRLDWTVQMDVMSDRVEVKGQTRVEPLPSGGCRRVVDGEINVRVRLVGGQIEKAVVAEFEKSMERAVEIARELIRERGVA